MQVETWNSHSNSALKTESPVSLVLLNLVEMNSFPLPDFFGGNRSPLAEGWCWSAEGRVGDEHVKGALSIPDLFSSKSQSLLFIGSHPYKYCSPVLGSLTVEISK